MFLFEVMFSCSDRNPAVETVKVLHHAEKLLFINKHKHSLCKTARKICQIHALWNRLHCMWIT